ncbi:xanthine dehydrogenase family protein molybdopterin-binding subunit [Mesorhizobium sp. ASY16-5R]|uniref:xanthine dehydrogenase family protein molybdopterin-binding subunit n=1 Tax=Mesorhizobium sp. ASY16-5R TaxID=3445772 RepID=UPI003FA06BCA
MLFETDSHWHPERGRETVVKGGIGQSVERREDIRFLRGLGRYTDDISAAMSGALHMVVVRSPHAAARILSIDAGAARNAFGVCAVLTGDDMAAENFHPLPVRMRRERRNGQTNFVPPYLPLAVDAVRHVGDAVAVVVAETHDQARDAAELVDVAYESTDCVTEVSLAASPEALRVWVSEPDNICFDQRWGDSAACDAAFASARHVVSERFVISRVATSSLEPRSALGAFDRKTQRYTLHAGLQSPHEMRNDIAAVFRLPPDRFRLVSPDVGGAFGLKGSFHPELVLVLWASRLTGRPVRHVCDRSEAFLSDHQSRDHVSEVSLALDEAGRFLGLRVSTLANLGAYIASDGLHSPTNNIGGLAGQYTTPAFDVRVQGVFTHTLPTCPYRGAGRPEASFYIEQIIDKAARRLGMDRAEIRRLNMIPPEAMPFKTPLVFTYDSGEFETVLDKCMAAADWSGFEARRSQAKARGMLRGIGIACVIEVAGGPHSRPFEESAEIRFDATGKVKILAGSHSQGQGHETVFVQMAREILGVPADDVQIIYGDTDIVAHGRGTFGSRTMMAFGAAFTRAAQKIIDKARIIAAHLLEADERSIEFTDGHFSVRGANRHISLTDIACAAFVPARMPAGLEIGLCERAIVALDKPTFPNGCHICEVEVDPLTGLADIVSYTVIDDVGTVVNPRLVKGQIHGGVAQGIGQVLSEQVVYADDGQIVTGSFMDYGMPRADGLPLMQVESHAVPTATNPLGVKGAGEAGTVGSLPATMSAIKDALMPAGVDHIDMPATPLRIWQALNVTGKNSAT